MSEQDYEHDAREQGWKPEEEWKGDPPASGFKTAEQFVKDGEQIPGILKSQIGRLNDQMDSMKGTFAEFQDYTRKQQEKSRKENERLISELEQVRAQAVTDGDGAAFAKADRDIQNLEPNEPKAEPIDPLGQEWATKSTWYGKDPELTELADDIYVSIQRDGYTGKAYYAELDRRVKNARPDKFENSRRNKASTVEGGGNRDTGGGEQTWANLPKEDRATAERFIAEMPGFTKEQFLSEYEWE